MKKIRFGVLSTASIAQTTLIPAIQRARNAEVVAIASSSDKAKRVADQLNIPKAYDSYEELLAAPDIDAVYIPLPNHLHKEWVMKAAKKGKHILCEKPATLTAEETREVVHVCKEHDVIFMEAFMYQFHPQHNRVKEIIASGEIGDIKLMRSSFSFYLDEPKGNIRVDPNKGGGCIYDVGCYNIHSIRNILDAEPIEIDVKAEIDPNYQVDTSASAYFKMDNGVIALFDCSFDMTLRHDYEVAGTHGRIKVPRAFRSDLYEGEGLIIVEKDDDVREEKIMGDQYAMEIEHFSNAILEGTAPTYSPEDTIQNMQVIDACLRSIEKN